MAFKKGNVSWNKGIKGKQSHSFGHIVSDVTKLKISKAVSGESNVNFGKSTWMKGKHHTEDSNQKNREKHIGAKMNFSEGGLQKKKEVALKNLPALLASDKNYNSESRNKKISESKKKQWQDIEWKEAVLTKVFASNKMKPNKLELSFQKLLDDHFPNTWKYVGDGKIWIAGKCPDYINIDGKKQFIELFGNYFHKSEDEEIRKSHFAKYGYDTLVIWESELKNPNVVSKIQEFAG